MSVMSKPQSWAIFCALKVQVRDLPLTYEQASGILDLANSDKQAARQLCIDLGGIVKGKLPADPREHEALFERAWKAGTEAAEALTPTPMVVASPRNLLGSLTGNGGGIDTSKPVYVVNSGVCGFAWVNVNPGNSSFARWLVKTGRARKHYNGGVNINVGGYGQSLEKKEAHASAAARVLQDAGIKAYSMSRMD